MVATKVRWTNHESNSTINSLIEEGGKEIQEQEEKIFYQLQWQLRKLRKKSLTYDLELIIEVPDLQNDTNTIVWNSWSGNYHDHRSKKAPTGIEKGDPRNAKG